MRDIGVTTAQRPTAADVSALRPHLTRLAVATGIAVLTALTFWPATGYEWLTYWDDGAHLLWNEQYKGLSPTHLWWMAHPFLGQFMPLTWLSWAIDFTLWGLDPVAYHRTNILLHAVAAGLLFLVAARVIRLALPECSESTVTFGAVFAALAWALHPLRVESVAWVNERRDVLSGVFYLLAVLTYLRGVTGAGQNAVVSRSLWFPVGLYKSDYVRRRWLIVSVLCFVLAVLSKALAVTLPIALLLIDRYPLRRRAWLEKAPYVLLAGIGAEMAFFAVAQMDVMAPIDWITIEDRLLIVPYSLWFYLAKTVWPGTLSPLYELTFTPHLFQWRYAIPIVGVGAGCWAAFRWRRTAPAWTVAWLAYVVAVLPISGLFQNGYQLVAARYAYLATLPLLIFAGGVIANRVERMRPVVREGALALAGGVTVALAVATTAYLPVFRDGIALWTRAVQVEPSCVACSDFLVHQGTFRQAHGVVSTALAGRPDLQEQRFHIGMLSFMYARGTEGEAHFTEYLRQAAERDPGYIARIEVGRQKHLAMAREVLTRSQEENLANTFEGAVYGLTPRPTR